MTGDQGVTRAACLTPPGTAAIATVAVCGPRALQLAQALFRPLGELAAEAPAKAAGESEGAAARDYVWRLERIEPGQFWVGRFGEDPKAATADQVVLTVVGAERVELHCHGGREMVRWILETLGARGVEVCSWQELELATNADSLQAAAVIQLAEAPTLRTAAHLLDQYHGAFRGQVEAVVAALDRGNAAQAGKLLEALARFADVGPHLTQPWRVAVVGAPNVGKSSLVNALAGYQRSVVAATPGTTRDIVTTVLGVDGWPVEIADTAGVREAIEALEEEGIQRARAAARGADLTLWVLDGSRPPVWPTEPGESAHFVINKIDLPAAWDFAVAPGAVAVSALTGEGIATLCDALASWLVPDPPPAGAAIPFTPALARQTRQTLQLCLAGQIDEAKRSAQRLRAAEQDVA